MVGSKTKWLAYADPNSTIRVVVPIGDIKEHQDLLSTCECGPSVEFLENGDMLIVHDEFEGT
jgi:hypothetical protein